MNKKIAWMVNNAGVPEEVIIEHATGDAEDFWQIENTHWSWQSGIIGEDFFLTRSEAWEAAGRRKELDVAEVETHIEQLQAKLIAEKRKRDQCYEQARMYYIIENQEEQENAKA